VNPYHENGFKNSGIDT